MSGFSVRRACNLALWHIGALRAVDVVDREFPHWKTTAGSERFARWVEQSPDRVLLAESMDPRDALALLDAYKARP